MNSSHTGVTARASIFIFIFMLSGLSGLIYESIWSHYLKLFLGHAAYAQSLVLAIFMGGMAGGSWLAGRFSVRWKNVLLGYALAEGLIGVSALLFHDLFDQFMTPYYKEIVPVLHDRGIIPVIDSDGDIDLLMSNAQSRARLYRNDTPHPGDSAPQGVSLLELSACHPDPESVNGKLSRLGIDLHVETGMEPRLVAVLESPAGRIELS